MPEIFYVIIYKQQILSLKLKYGQNKVIPKPGNQQMIISFTIKGQKMMINETLIVSC